MTDIANSQPLDISRRFATVGVAVLLAVSASLLAKQIVFFRVASRDACGFYLPLARAWADGEYSGAQHVMIPPVYPMLVGSTAHLLPWAQDPCERAGQLINAVSVLYLVVLIYHMGRLVWSRRVGLAAAALTAANPWLIRFGSKIGPDMLYAVFLAGATLATLAYYKKGPSPARAVAAGALAALAALTRGEGLFLAPLLGMILLLTALKPSPSRKKRLVHLAAFLLTVTVLFWPRATYMKQQTGYPVLDIRLLRVINGRDFTIDKSWWQTVLTDTEPIGRIQASSRSMAEVVDEAQETLLWVFGPATWILAAVWFFGRRNLPRQVREQMIIAAVVLCQLAVVIRVKMDRRYVAAVTGLVQIWGGLGMVVLAEWLRTRKGAAARFGGSIGLQMVALSALIAGLACWSVLSTNAGVRHSELRELGMLARSTAGSSRPVTLLATSTRSTYYAQGRMVLVRDPASDALGLSRAELRETCLARQIDFIVIRSREHWCAWLLDQIEADRLPDGALLAARRSPGRDEKKIGRLTSYLLDARKLFPLSPAVSDAATASDDTP